VPSVLVVSESLEGFPEEAPSEVPAHELDRFAGARVEIRQLSPQLVELGVPIAVGACGERRGRSPAVADVEP
jgi:hypothetical protein